MEHWEQQKGYQEVGDYYQQIGSRIGTDQLSLTKTGLSCVWLWFEHVVDMLTYFVAEL